MKKIEIQIAAIEEAIQLGRAGEPVYLIKVGAKYETDISTLKRWMSKVRGVPRSEWPNALKGLYKGRVKLADLTPEAWDYFLEQYNQTASLQAAYQACIERAQQEGWAVPSARTLQRRLSDQNLVQRRRRRFTDFDV